MKKLKSIKELITKKITKIDKRYLLVGSMLCFLLVGIQAHAQFLRQATSTSHGYGYGYGYDYGYGYGYGYGAGSGVASASNYGFFGADGKATIVSATGKTEDSLTIAYTTSYTAKNRIEYGTATTSFASSSSAWADVSYQTSGSYSISATSLSANTTYYYRVATKDASGTVWYSTASYETATTTAAGVVTVTPSVINDADAAITVSGVATTTAGMFDTLGITSASFSQATLDTAISSNISLSAGTVEMTIPVGTVVYAATSSFTSIPAPSADTSYTSASSLTAGGSNYNPIGPVVEFGISGISLIFSNIVTVTIPGVTESPNSVIYSVDGTTWQTISQCDANDISSTVTTNITFPGACFGYNSATDVITLKTYHFTKFAGVSAAATTVDGGGGGGGGYTAPTVTGPTTDTGIVTASTYSGGSTTLTNDDGGSVSLIIPGGAISDPTTFTITNVSSGSVPSTPSGLFMVAGQIYQINAAVDGSSINAFNSSLTLTFTYTDDQISGVSENSLQIYYYDNTLGLWMPLDTTINTENNTATVSVIHFSDFALMTGEGDGVTEEVEEETPVSEMTIEELEAKIVEILAQIADLKTQLAELTGEAVYEGIPSDFSFETNFKTGAYLQDVVYLKAVLDIEVPDHQSWTGTEYYGPKTQAAVKTFQEKYTDEVLASWGLTEGTGYVGTTTRAKLNALLGK